jgi:Trp operon repressor
MSGKYKFASDSRKAILSQSELGQKIARAMTNAIKAGEDWSEYNIKIQFLAKMDENDENILISNLVITPKESQELIDFSKELEKL